MLNLHGYVLGSDSVALECKLGYRTGMNAYGGFIWRMHRGELAGAVPADAEQDVDKALLSRL